MFEASTCLNQSEVVSKAANTKGKHFTPSEDDKIKKYLTKTFECTNFKALCSELPYRTPDSIKHRIDYLKRNSRNPSIIKSENQSQMIDAQNFCKNSDNGQKQSQSCKEKTTKRAAIVLPQIVMPTKTSSNENIQNEEEDQFSLFLPEEDMRLYENLNELWIKVASFHL